MNLSQSNQTENLRGSLSLSSETTDSIPHLIFLIWDESLDKDLSKLTTRDREKDRQFFACCLVFIGTPGI